MAVTRKEQIASGKKVTPLTREELRLAGKTFAPLTEEERFHKIAYAGEGGGGSDFAIANVTLTKTGLVDDMLFCTFPAIKDGACVGRDTIEKSSGEESLQIPMYNGSAVIGGISKSYELTVTGDITVNPDTGVVTVAGDGSLNIAGTNK